MHATNLSVDHAPYKSRIHLVGVGGVGMSALAQALLDRGCSVSGSDRLLDHGDETVTLKSLQQQGVTLYRQDGSGIRSDVMRVVISSAIESDNPELVACQARKIPVAHRAAELARLVAEHQLIAVTGTSGKSTVTAILGWLLTHSGCDPLVVNGAAVPGWDCGGGRLGSVRSGRGKWAVIEADESDHSLLAFRPYHAIITNRSADHFDLAETDQLFDRFCKRVTGVVLEEEPPGTALHAATGWSGSFTLEGTNFRVPLPGRHNLNNAWQAVRMARLIGVELTALQRALATFPGVERRLQRVGVCNGAAVIDDYAHNPAKLTAAWHTVAASYPRIAALWRPHGYGPLRSMFEALAETFVDVMRPRDKLFLLPVYDAGGTARRDVHSGLLAERLIARGLNVKIVNTIAYAELQLRAAAQSETALLICGARDPELPRLARRLTEEHG